MRIRVGLAGLAERVRLIGRGTTRVFVRCPVCGRSHFAGTLYRGWTDSEREALATAVAVSLATACLGGAAGQLHGQGAA